MDYNFGLAKTENISDVFSLYQQRVQWMDATGLKQWNVTDYLNAFPLSYYYALQEAGKLYVLTEGKQVAGALALFDHDDYWPDSDNASAYYIHHLVSDINHRGAGRFLLKQAEKIATLHGKEYLRLDCAADNITLFKYYEKMGYVYAGKCQDGPYIGKRLTKKLY